MLVAQSALGGDEMLSLTQCNDTQPARRIVSQAVAEAAAKLIAERNEARFRLATLSEIDPLSSDAESIRAIESTGSTLELERRLVDMLALQLRRLDEAVGRVADDTFGACIDCDEAIADARLLADPAVERCLDCQLAREGDPRIRSL